MKRILHRALRQRPAIGRKRNIEFGPKIEAIHLLILTNNDTSKNPDRSRRDRFPKYYHHFIGNTSSNVAKLKDLTPEETSFLTGIDLLASPFLAQFINTDRWTEVAKALQTKLPSNCWVDTDPTIKKVDIATKRNVLYVKVCFHESFSNCETED